METQNRGGMKTMKKHTGWRRTLWYVVSEDTTIEDRINVTGDVHLILCDGATLTAKHGIRVVEGNSLTIYG